jgi:glycosyltransferase involved in cell wall biosynthesis
MQQDYGLVSVIMPTYNCAAFISDTIKSVQSQTYTNWEIIIVDDCSADNTKEVVDAFNDSRIRYFKNAQNSGAALSRNWAIREAKGRWIAFLDSDDLWLPNKLEHQLKFMVENNYKFTYHEYSEISEEGQELGIHVSGIHKVNKFNIYSCCWQGCLSVIYDSDAIGLIQIKDVRKNNDTAMWLRVVCKSPCYLLKEDLARYRRRKSSITPKPIWERIWAHYPLFRIAEQMNPITAAFWTMMNVFGNGYKKLFYVTKTNN